MCFDEDSRLSVPRASTCCVALRTVPKFAPLCRVYIQAWNFPWFRFPRIKMRPANLFVNFLIKSLQTNYVVCQRLVWCVMLLESYVVSIYRVYNAFRIFNKIYQHMYWYGYLIDAQFHVEINSGVLICCNCIKYISIKVLQEIYLNLFNFFLSGLLRNDTHYAWNGLFLR